MAIHGTRIVPNKLVLDFQHSNLFAIREVVANQAARVDVGCGHTAASSEEFCVTV